MAISRLGLSSPLLAHCGLSRTGLPSHNPVAIGGEKAVMSSVSKRSIVIAGHKTSVSLEDAFWNSVREIATERGVTLGELVRGIDANRNHPNLSSAIRLFVLGVYRDQHRQDRTRETLVREVRETF